MATLFPVDTFTGFGPTTARPLAFEPTLGRVKSRKSKKLRAGVRADAPKQPGVYGMLGKHGELIYVGKAKSLRARLMSYFRESRDRKAGRILQHTHTLVWETVPDEFGALVRELELIRRHRPRFNVLGQPGRQRYCYVCLGRTPAPYAYVSRAPTGKDLGVYGPFTSASRASEAVRRLNDWYRLRDCAQTVTMYFAEQGELFPEERSPGCLRLEIGTCVGPCAGACTRNGYGSHVRAAKRFLDGTDDKPLKELEAMMLTASESMQFERAAAIRDRRAEIEWLWDKLNWLRQARKENTFVYPLAGPDGRTVWYLIHRGRVRAACYRPTCDHSLATARELLGDVFKVDLGPGVTPGQVDHVLLVSSWFRRNPEEKAGLLTPADAHAIGVDAHNRVAEPRLRKRKKDRAA
ncbi:MAG TPA: GIY-YIG nuclease family protein [Gemmataceae bacterium]|nr:GIY-YIG nuclease family protein [Gemmataceae bacterium]